MELRPCQIDAFNCVKERFESSQNESNLSLCTGAGKSKIIQLCSRDISQRVIIVFPSLLLLNQYYKDYAYEYKDVNLYYMATEGTLRGIPRLSSSITELNTIESWCILTTYVSAPVIYSKLTSTITPHVIIHDEAHHITATLYATGLSTSLLTDVYRVNLSATLPDSKTAHYKYPLLKGIRDGVVRDFNMDLFLCVNKERDMGEKETALLELIVKKLLTHHSNVKLLIYTREANTVGDGVSSVNTFLSAHSTNLRKHGWWIDGINESTADRGALLKEFEQNKGNVSILVSCRTLSEGIDLKGANCMLPWDPTASVVDNIQRIGRVLRLYKDAKGKILKEQPPSSVVIPVFLPEDEYLACEGDKDAIHKLLESHIAEGERGNFRPIVNVCTALKSELAEEDAELFNTLLDYPRQPKVTVDRGLFECVAKACKKSLDSVTDAVAEALEEKDGCEEIAEAVREGEWDQEDAGDVVDTLAKTQGITLVICDGDDVEMFGSGAQHVTVEKQSDGVYKSVKNGTKKAAADIDAARKRVAHRMRANFSDDCQILLGLDSVEGADTTGGMVLSRLTMEVKTDENWEARRLEWVAVYEKLGRNPSSKSKDLNEKRAAKWQSHQRQNYKNNAWLTPERIAALNATANWTWEKADMWESNRLHWVAMYKKLGKTPKYGSTDPDEKRACSWRHNQLVSYKKKEACLTSERIDILNETPGWTWESEDTWEPNRLHWVAMYDKLGRNPSDKAKDPDEKRAAKWQCHQRQYYKKKQSYMTPERIAILNATPNWTWEVEDTWEPNRINWLKMYNKLGRNPSEKSDDLDEKRAGSWQSNQRKLFKKKETCMTHERISILNTTPGWTWDSDTWEQSRLEWVSFYNKFKRSPSCSSKITDEKHVAMWQSHQRNDYKKKEARMTPERIATLNATPGWTWSAKESPVTPYIPPVIENTFVYSDEPSSTIRKRYIPTKDAEKTSESKETPVQRHRSALEKFHKRFKTMNASTYKNAIAETPDEFAKYHDVADKYDARDPPDRQPLTKIAALLTSSNKPSYTAIDLGCGRNRLRTLPEVNRMKWTSVDVHAVDETVTVADIGALPYEDDTYDIAVLGRSLWARNHEDVLREIWRILKVGGRVVICESFQRWLAADGHNTLITCLRELKFDIIYEEGTKISDAIDDVFQYVVARK